MLPRPTAHAVTGQRGLCERVDAVRRADYAIAIEEHELGVHALAAPLRNMQGQAVAALNDVTSPGHLGREAMKRQLRPLL